MGEASPQVSLEHASPQVAGLPALTPDGDTQAEEPNSVQVGKECHQEHS